MCSKLIVLLFILFFHQVPARLSGLQVRFVLPHIEERPHSTRNHVHCSAPRLVRLREVHGLVFERLAHVSFRLLEKGEREVVSLFLAIQHSNAEANTARMYSQPRRQRNVKQGATGRNRSPKQIYPTRSPIVVILWPTYW